MGFRCFIQLAQGGLFWFSLATFPLSPLAVDRSEEIIIRNLPNEHSAFKPEEMKNNFPSKGCNTRSGLNTS